MNARRYAVVGTGARAGLYIRALAGRYAADGTIVAWCDTNRARMNYYDEILTGADRPSPAQYGADGPRLVDQGNAFGCTYLLQLAHRSPESLRDVVAHLGRPKGSTG